MTFLTGENNIVITKGANNCISPDQLKASVDVIVNAKVALFQLEVDFAATLFALKLAYENGGKFYYKITLQNDFYIGMLI